MQKLMRLQTVVVAITLCASNAWANRYSITDLGLNETPSAINKVDAVASEFKVVRGEIYRNGKWRNLPSHSEVLALNRGMDAVGDDFKEQTAVLWPHNATPVVLPLPEGATRGAATGINDSQTIVGKYYTADSVQCFMWTPGHGVVDLGAGQWFLCATGGVNSLGQVTGQIAESGISGNLAFLWDQGNFTILGTLPGTSISTGIGINDEGQIVGASYADLNLPRGFLWNGALVDLDPQQRFAADMPLAINNRGDIVGWARKNSEKGDMSAVRFARLQVIELGPEVTNGENWKLEAATSVNDKGVIVGYGLLNGALHGFMLTPQ